MSGGGKCNFTNLDVEPSNYISENPHFVISALTVTPTGILLVWSANMALNMKNVNTVSYLQSKVQKKFSNFLLAECNKAKRVQIQTHCEVKSITAQTDSGFIIETNQGTYHCESLVV